MTTPALRACILVLLWPSAGVAQPSMPADTVEADSVELRTMPGFGLAVLGIPLTAVRDSVWYWSNERTLPGVLRHMPGLFGYETGEEGKPVLFSARGSADGTEQLYADGLPTASPGFGRSRVTTYPLEFVERVEMLDGPEAVLTGARWNIVTRQFVTPKPVTAVRFVQEPDETITSDAFFAQNVARATSVLFGFQRRVTDGRFRNSRLGSWNLRGRVRSNLSPSLNLALNWNYEKTTNGFNGGIDLATTTSVFDNVAAAVAEPDAYEVLERRDLSLVALMDLFGDSLSLTRVAVQRRSDEWEFTRPFPTANAPSRRIFARSSELLVRAEQSLAAPYLLIRAAGQWSDADAERTFEARSAARRGLTVAALAEGRFSRLIVPSVAVRYGDASGATETGARLSLHPGEGFEFAPGVEQRTFAPSLHAQTLADTMLIRPVPLADLRETTFDIAARWHVSDVSEVSLRVYQKNQRGRLFVHRASTPSGHPALRATLADIRWTGGDVGGTVWIGPISAGGSISFASNDAVDSLSRLLPQVWGRWEVGWKDGLFNDELGLRLAVRGTFFDRFAGVTPDQETLLPVVQTAVSVRRMTTLDAYLVLEIGSAVVALSWENLLNTDYYIVPVYPMPDRRFSLGVRWTFDD